MGRLGDYIHLKADNYRTYGIGKYGTSSPIFYNYASSAHFLKTRLNQAGVKRIDEATLNTLRARMKSNTPQQMTKDEEACRRDQQVQLDYIYELLYQQVYNIDKTKKGITHMTSGQGYRYNKKIGTGERISTSSQWSSSKSHAELMDIRNKKMAEYRALTKEIKKFNNSKQKTEKDFQKIVKLYNKYMPMDSKHSTLGEITQALSDFRYQGTAQQVAGAFGEYVFAACNDTATQLGQKEFYNMLKETVVGSQQTKITIPKDLIYKNAKTNFLKQENGTTYSLGKTQDKVDVNIKVNNDDLFISVKDYAVKEGDSQTVTLQKEVNLFQTITYLESLMNGFGTHWLNMHALAGNFKQRSAADNIVKKEVAYEALIGGSPFKKGVSQANVFGYMNRATGEVYIQSTRDILEKNNLFNKILGLQKVDGVKISSNRLEPTPEIRIGNILNELHANKLHITMKI